MTTPPPPSEAGGQRKTPAELRDAYLELLELDGDSGYMANLLDELLEATSRERAAAQLREVSDRTIGEYARELGLPTSDKNRIQLSRLYWDGYSVGRRDGLDEIRDFIEEVR